MIEPSTTRPRLLAPVAVLVALAVGAAGCECSSGMVQNATRVRCDYVGGGSLSSPTFPLPTTFSVTTAGSCLEADGTCGHNGSVLFDVTSRDVEGNALVLSIMATPAVAPGTYALTPESVGVFIKATIYWYGNDRSVMYEDLDVQSGALVLTRNDGDRFSGTFTMELETPNGLHHLSVTAGAFDVGPCSIRTEEVCVVTND